jgi:hypothetical protein
MDGFPQAGYRPLTPEQLENEAVAARDFARMMRARYTAFEEVGFLPGEALGLTKTFMRCMLGGGGGDD